MGSGESGWEAARKRMGSGWQAGGKQVGSKWEAGGKRLRAKGDWETLGVSAHFVNEHTILLTKIKQLSFCWQTKMSIREPLAEKTKEGKL